MGNCCCKEKKDNIKSEIMLRQVIILKRGNCNICDNENVMGYDVKSVIENQEIFICLECKNLK
jgi:hypothetical protein